MTLKKYLYNRISTETSPHKITGLLPEILGPASFFSADPFQVSLALFILKYNIRQVLIFSWILYKVLSPVVLSSWQAAYAWTFSPFFWPSSSPWPWLPVRDENVFIQDPASSTGNSKRTTLPDLALHTRAPDQKILSSALHKYPETSCTYAPAQHVPCKMGKKKSAIKKI